MSTTGWGGGITGRTQRFSSEGVPGDEGPAGGHAGLMAAAKLGLLEHAVGALGGGLHQRNGVVQAGSTTMRYTMGAITPGCVVTSSGISQTTRTKHMAVMGYPGCSDLPGWPDQAQDIRPGGNVTSGGIVPMWP